MQPLFEIPLIDKNALQIQFIFSQLTSIHLKNILKQGYCGYTKFGGVHIENNVHGAVMVPDFDPATHPQTHQDLELEVTLSNPRGFLLF